MREALQRFVPPDLQGETGSRLEAVWAGLGAALADIEAGSEALLAVGKLATAEDMFLDLHARGLGVRRGSGESDASLRVRARVVSRKVTKPAIQAVLNSILDTETEERAHVYDRMDALGWAVEEDAAEEAALLCDHLSIYIALPLLPQPEDALGAEVGALEEAPMDLFPEHPLMAVLRAEVNRLRAAGVRAFFFYYWTDPTP